MICNRCSFRNDLGAVVCRSCGSGPLEYARPAGGGLVVHDDTFELRIADAELRLAALTEHIRAVDVERAAIAEAIGLARRAAVKLRRDSHAAPELDPIALSQAPSTSATIDVGSFRVRFGKPGGSSIERVRVRTAIAPIEASRRTADTVLSRDRLRIDGVTAVWDAFNAGAMVVRIAADPGAGATTLLDVLAEGAFERGFDDVVRLTDIRGPAGDIAARITAFVAPAASTRYYLADEIPSFLGAARILVLLDRAMVSADEQSELCKLMPSLNVVIVDSLRVPGTSTIELGPLDSQQTLASLEFGCGRRIASGERDAALEIAATLGSLVGPTRLSGIAASELNRTFTSLRGQYADGNAIVSALIMSLAPMDRTVLGVLALAAVPLTAPQLGHVVRAEIGGSLERLADCELICRHGALYAPARSIESLVPPLADTDVALERIFEVLTAACDPQQAAPLPDGQLAAIEPIVQTAFERSQWPRVLALGPRVGTLFARQGSFGAWGRVLNLVAAAAKRTGDSTALDAARHELGVRALLVGEYHKALTSLQSAARSRQRAGDDAGAHASNAVLALVLEGEPAAPATIAGDVIATVVARALPVDDRGVPHPGPPSALPVAEAAPAASSDTRARRSRGRATPPPLRRSRRRTRSPFRSPLTATQLLLLGVVAVVAALLTAWSWARPKSATAIAEFSVDRPLLTNGGSAQLCVRATGAVLVDISPDVGAVPPEGKHCVAVYPAATTTYTVVATGATGHQARTTLTIAVHPPAGVSIASRHLEITAFAARPARLRVGQSTQLCYAVTGADLLRIVPSVGTLVRLRACRTLTPSEPHSYTYKLLAIGENGQLAVRRARIEVAAALTPAPSTPAPAVSPAESPSPAPARQLHPVARSNGRLARRAIYQFDATPAVVERGQAASLCVGVGRWAQGNVTGIGALSPGITRCYRVHPFSTTVYRLRVALDSSVSVESVTVAVRPPVRANHEVAHSQRSER